jgi:HEAT repeat protein
MNESELLRQLNHPDWEVRASAVRNPNATEPVLLKALKDKILAIRKAATEHPNATERLLISAPSSPIGFCILLSHVGRR